MSRKNSLLVGLVLSILSFFLTSCQIGFGKKSEKETSLNIINEEHITQKSTKNFDIESHLLHYEKLKSKIASEKLALKNENNNEIITNKFTTLLVDSVFSYWYGTPWDFNGHTAEPLNGHIACGYFVTTTLKHLGVKLNRYKLAQQASSVMINELCAEASVKRFNSLNKLKDYLLQFQDESVFILGLDYHVGFVAKRNGKLLFIHANYFGNSMVESEFLLNSAVIKSSENYMIGSLTDNKKLMRTWSGR